MQCADKKRLGQITHFIFSQTPRGIWDIPGGERTHANFSLWQSGQTQVKLREMSR